MRVGVASCTSLPDWEVDDQPLFAALRGCGATVEVHAWDSPALDPAGERALPDVVLLRTTWDYVQRHEEFLVWCEALEQRTTLLNPAKVVRWNLDKRYLRALSELGVRITPTLWVERGDVVDLESLRTERGWLDLFVKPCVGASASDTARARRDKPFELRAAQRLVEELSQGVGAMVQPYWTSVETEGELSWIVIDGRFSHAVRKVPARDDYRVQDDWGAHDEPYASPARDVQRAEKIVERAAALLRLDGLLYARVDMLRADDGELVLNELELVEPSLFFRHHAPAARTLAEGLIARARATPSP